MGTFCIEDARARKHNVICEKRFSDPRRRGSRKNPTRAHVSLSFVHTHRPLHYSRDETISTLTGFSRRLRARRGRGEGNARNCDVRSTDVKIMARPRTRVKERRAINLCKSATFLRCEYRDIAAAKIIARVRGERRRQRLVCDLFI